MKKKAVFKIIIFTLIILIILLGGLLLSEKSGLIENIGNIRSKKIEEKEIIKIDVTDLEDNENIGHEHIFKTMYDESKHWEECTVCKIKNDEIIHSYTDNGWSYGSSCNEKNVHKYSCSCGYSYTTKAGKPNHTMYRQNHPDSFRVANTCSRCGYSEVIHNCIKSDGSKISCNNPGVCKLCSYNYSASVVYHAVDSKTYIDDNITGRTIYCARCKIELGSINYARLIRESNNVYNYQVSINFTNGNRYTSMQTYDSLAGLHSVSNIKTSTSSTSCVIERRFTYNEYLENGGYMQYNCCGIVNNVTNSIIILFAFIDKLDNVEPIISSITMGESEELTEWSRTKPIIVAGTENYCKSVNVKIVDENENVVFEGKGSVNNPNDSGYSVSCIPELEVDTNGKTFKAIVTDACGNSVEKEFTIAKIDAIPPTATSGDDITGQWAKSRKFTFKATDYGIGEVQIAFNDIDNLGLANFDGTEYSRDYEFVGDVYGEKQLSVLYRDGLGNTSIQKITINNLDNTAPTIEKASIHNNIVTVEANDRHERLGEGSGIVKYRYVASSEKLNNPDVSNGIEVADDKFIVDDVYKAKYIYIVAEDAVGNVSGVYELKVPELILTSSVDLSLANGKGGVILDWTTYDVVDKYFVIYRKEENATDWENIVSLDKKLTGSTYTDILGNDKTKPDVPNINITGDAQNNNIKIEATSNDNGTKYLYYIEAYDDNGTLLQTSI